MEANTTQLWTSSGFWQTPMEGSSKQYTAFTVGMLGFFQCERMPFGLCNTPATFQWLMTNCLGELNYLTCSVYLNDVVIYSSTQEEHVECVPAVLECFRLHRLKLKPSKCEFFKEKIEYLGHSVSSKGVWLSRDNLKAIAKFPDPQHTQLLRVSSDSWGTTEASLRTLPRSRTLCMNM